VRKPSVESVYASPIADTSNNFRFAPVAFRTLTVSAVTSGPIPSPGISIASLAAGMLIPPSNYTWAFTVNN
jgi:hypothetical protein